MSNASAGSLKEGLVRHPWVVAVGGGLVVGLVLLFLEGKEVPGLSAAGSWLAKVLVQSVTLARYQLLLLVATALALGGSGILLRQQFDRKRREASSTGEGERADDDIDDGMRVYVRETPDEMQAHLKSIAPFDRTAVARVAYIDKWIRCTGSVRSLHAYETELRLLLRVSSPGPEETYVSMLFDTRHRVALSHIREGEDAVVTGQITEITPHTLQVSRCRLVLPAVADGRD